MKKSFYNIQSNIENNKILLFNTYSQALVELDNDGILAYESLNPENEFANEFEKLGYWIHDDNDEYTKLMFKNQEAVFNTDEIRIVFKMTNACNFRCPYCYQKHEENYLDNTILKVLKNFLNKQKKIDKHYIISYFGGEPTMCIPQIIKIQKFLNKEEFNYNSSITTNGYLLTPQNVEMLINNGVNSAYITIDGDEMTHNKTRILPDGSGSYKQIIKNIQEILENTNMNISIRCNLSKSNEDSVKDFLDHLNKHNILGSRDQIVFNELIDHHGNDNLNTFDTRKEYAQSLLKSYKLLMDAGYNINRCGHLTMSCALDRQSAYVFTPNLEIESCTSDEKAIGRLDDEGNLIYHNNYYLKMLRRSLDKPKCKHCKVMPMCMGGCTLLESKHKESCIPEKYIINELIPLYYESVQRKDK